MKKLAPAISFLLIILLVSFRADNSYAIRFQPYYVPAQEFDAWAEMGAVNLHDTIQVKDFEFSWQIRLWEYKEYLEAIKKDSTEAFYKSQFPDSGMSLRREYEEYLANPLYDQYPVVGVSWDNACNYLHWLTVRENKDTILDTLYRLPYVSEWVSANFYFKDKHLSFLNMNRDYADWTLNAKDESTYSFDYGGKYKMHDYSYDALPNDPPVLKRKVVIGNSFRFSQPNLYDCYSWSYYEDHGYSHISFRFVKEVLSKEEMERRRKIREKMLKTRIQVK